MTGLNVTFGTWHFCPQGLTPSDPSKCLNVEEYVKNKKKNKENGKNHV